VDAAIDGIFGKDDHETFYHPTGGGPDFHRLFYVSMREFSRRLQCHI